MRFIHEVTVRPSELTTDARGNKVRKPIGTPFASPAWMQPGTGEEILVDGQTSIIDYVFFAPPNTSCDAWSEVVWEGATYQALADPKDWRTPQGKHHLTVPLRRIGGA